MRLTPALLAVFLLAPLLGADDPSKKPTGKTYQVPYRLTDTKHVMVRAKINGKGPYNFIIDTGAPALFVATAVAAKLGVEADDRGWGVCDRFEIEGGVVVDKAKARIADPFQLEGMNKLGLAGVELHGVVGYSVLARYRITFDFSKDQLAWTALDFEPPAPRGGGGKDAGVDALGGLVKALAALLGDQLRRETRYRGFLGVELAEKNVIAAVLPDSPAAGAGLLAGDRIVAVNGKNVDQPAQVQEYLAGQAAGQAVELDILRKGAKQTIEVTLGKGL
jgi:PDZ domain/Aspartyl protease